MQYFAQTFFNFNKNTRATNNIIYTFAPLFLMKDYRKQRILATICHVVRHLLGRFLDFEIHTVPSGYHRTISLFHFYRTNFMRALYGVLLRAHVPEHGMWRDNKFSSCMDFHRIYVYVCRIAYGRGTLYIYPLY